MKGIQTSERSVAAFHFHAPKVSVAKKCLEFCVPIFVFAARFDWIVL